MSALSEDNPEFSTSISPSSVNVNPRLSTTVYMTAGVGVGGTGDGVGGTGVFGTTNSGSAVGVDSVSYTHLTLPTILLV